MNALSALGGARSAGGGGSAEAYAGRDSGQAPAAFARLLEGSANTPTPAPAPRPPSSGTPAQPDAAAPQPQPKAKPKTQASDRDEGKAGGARSEAPAESQPAGSGEAAQAEAAEADTDETMEHDPAATAADAAWPPPGLAGLGLPAPQAVVGEANAAPVPPATAAAFAALPETEAAAHLTAAAGPRTDASAAPAQSAAAVPGIALPATGTGPAAAAGPAASAEPAALHAGLPAGETAQADAPLRSAPAAGQATAPAIDSPVFTLPGLPQAALRAQGAPAVFSASPTPTPQLHSEAFDEAVGTRVAWLAEQKIGHAHIKLNPNELGPVEIRLQLDGDKVHASFSSAHAEVRQALEQSLPRLRDLLGEQGFQLGQADVGAQQQGQRGDAAAAGAQAGAGEDPASEAATQPAGPLPALRARGLLDAYA